MAYSGQMVTQLKSSFEKLDKITIKGTDTANDKLPDILSATQAVLLKANMTISELRRGNDALGSPIPMWYGEWELLDTSKGIQVDLLHHLGKNFTVTSGNPFSIKLHEDITTGYKICPVCFFPGFNCIHGKPKVGGKRARTQEDKAHDKTNAMKRMKATKEDAGI